MQVGDTVVRVDGDDVYGNDLYLARGQQNPAHTHTHTHIHTHTHTHKGFMMTARVYPSYKPSLMLIPLITAKTGKKLAELAEVLLGPAGSTVQIDFRCGSSKKEFSVIVPVCARLSSSLSAPLHHTVACRRALHVCDLGVRHASSCCSLVFCTRLTPPF